MDKITYKKSFAAKLVLAGEPAIEVYQTLKDACLTHKGVKTRQSFNHETINFGRQKVGVIKLGRKNISLYLALEPEKYANTKYMFTDVSDKKNYIKYPMLLKLKSKRSVKYACELLQDVFSSVGATTLCQTENINYLDVYYARSFETLVAEGLIKKYVKRIVNGKSSLVEEKPLTYRVNFKAKLLYDAANKAEKLYIITNYDNWSTSKAIEMNKDDNGVFTKTVEYPSDTKLEFKICRSSDWKDVEKGIWKEEIKNHNYVVVDHDIEIEDLIHNFRNEE